jgi:transposase
LLVSPSSKEAEMSRPHLTRRQRDRLRLQLGTASDARTYRRTLAVLELDRGRSAADVAAMLGVTRQSIHNWAAAYAGARDPAALADRGRSGRPRRLGEADLDLLGHLLARSPRDLGHPHAEWTVPLLRGEFDEGPGAPPSDETVRRALRRIGYRWKRPRYVLEPDPERDKKTPHPAAGPGPAAP